MEFFRHDCEIEAKEDFALGAQSVLDWATQKGATYLVYIIMRELPAGRWAVEGAFLQKGDDVGYEVDLQEDVSLSTIEQAQEFLEQDGQRRGELIGALKREHAELKARLATTAEALEKLGWKAEE